MDARPSSQSERVALREGCSVVGRVRDRDTCTDGIARPEEGSEVRLKGDPERGNNEVVPAAVAATAPVTTNVAGTGFLRAQRARATALSSLMRPG
jgi:hypothetical protein